MPKNQLEITAHIFDNTGSVYLRTEDMIIPLPALFVPCNSPRADMDINSKIIFGAETGYVEEIYVEETIDELDDLVYYSAGEASLVTYEDGTTARYEDNDIALYESN